MKQLVMALLTLSLTLSAGEVKDPVLREHYNSTFRVRIYTSAVDQNGDVTLIQRGAGTATAIDDHHLLTARHLAEHDMMKIEQVDLEGNLEKEYIVTKSTLSETDDLAILEVEETLPAHVELKYGETSIGDDIFMVGFPLGIGRIITRGIFSGVNHTPGLGESDGQAHWIPGGPGNSGSLVRNVKGEVVGVLVAGYSEAPVVIFVRADTVKSFVEKSMKGDKLKSGKSVKPKVKKSK